MFLSLPGSSEAHTVKVNQDKRLIVGLEATMKLLSKEIGKEVPGVVSVSYCPAGCKRARARARTCRHVCQGANPSG